MNGSLFQFLQNMLMSNHSPYGMFGGYNPSLFPYGLYTNANGQFATPYSQTYGAGPSGGMAGSGWYNALMPQQGQTPQLPNWAGAANPYQASQMWADQQNQNAYGTGNQQTLGILASAGFPMFNDPRNMQDFAANTFGMQPMQFNQGYYGQFYGAPAYGYGSEGGGGKAEAGQGTGAGEPEGPSGPGGGGEG